MSTIGLILLAAGASTRMGTPKQLLRYQGRSLISHSVQVAIASGCCPIVVVLGAQADQIKAEVDALPLHLVENKQWHQGIGSSIRVGMTQLLAIQPKIAAAVLLLCDQPYITSSLIQQLVEVYQTNHKPIVASAYAQTLGVPALFDRILFPKLLTLNAAIGAKQIIQQHRHEANAILFPEGAIDVDTPADYQQLQAIHQPLSL